MPNTNDVASCAYADAGREALDAYHGVNAAGCACTARARMAVAAANHGPNPLSVNAGVRYLSTGTRAANGNGNGTTNGNGDNDGDVSHESSDALPSHVLGYMIAGGAVIAVGAVLYSLMPADPRAPTSGN